MKIHIGLGSNMGDRSAAIADALRRLDELDNTEVRAVSHLYESEPWGVVDQPAFANAVAVLETGFRPDDLLGELKEIEQQMGRGGGPRNGPRVIDLDVLLAETEEWDTSDLVVPHPRMLEREFVVTPLLDVDPHVRMPDGSAVTSEAAVHGRVIGMLGPVPGFEDRTWGEMMPDGSRLLITEAPDSPEMPPLREAFPDEPWVPVWQRPGYTPVFSMPGGMLEGAGTGGHVGGAVPNVEANFAQLVLEQQGIPHAWDPFPPERASDPYGLSRPFQLLVPQSMAEEARTAIEEASDAPIDWGDMPR